MNISRNLWPLNKSKLSVFSFKVSMNGLSIFNYCWVSKKTLCIYVVAIDIYKPFLTMFSYSREFKYHDERRK